jgi:DNA helicase HerA-like ATPase
MTDTPAAKVLTETFLTIIRQQRHLGVRTIISTQEPTISPRLIDLCSLTIIHRFTSPEWYKTIEKHVPMNSENARQLSERIPDGFYRIASLRTGEAIVFASSSHLVGEDGTVIDTKHRTFTMMMRKRVTWDGGKSIVCIR